MCKGLGADLISNKGPKVSVKVTFTRLAELLGKRGEILNFVRVSPVDTEVGSPGEFGVDDHDRPPIPIKKWVAVGKKAHDFAWLFSHKRLVLPDLQGMLYRAPCVFGMGEKNRAFADSNARNRCFSILTSPRVNCQCQPKTGPFAN